ncbi:MAG: hypothetical protein JWN44_6798, partial [Myxococcales bacterium]|nr:hypothetical protein [Myxococcales bacterium]
MRRLLTLALLVAGCGDHSLDHEIPYVPPAPPPMTPDMATEPPPSTNGGPQETRLSKEAGLRALTVDRSHNAFWVGAGDGAVWSASIDYPQSARVVIPRTTEVAFSNDVLLAWNSVRGTSTTSTSLAT